jgi:hypothetical protein
MCTPPCILEVARLKFRQQLKGLMLAEGEELGSNPYRRPTELGGLDKVARAAQLSLPGPKAAKRPFCPGAAPP